VPNISQDCWIFVAMATQVYLVMFVLMFVAKAKVRRSQPNGARGYRGPLLGHCHLPPAVR
jgi:hypothetical protein